MNAKKVPQLFVATGATSKDPQNFPWTMGWQPNYQSEGRIYAAYIKKNYPNGKIAAIWQNDDAGKDQMKGLRDGLGDKANRSSPTSRTRSAIPPSTLQIVALKDPAPTSHDLGRAEGRRTGDPQVAELGWKPVYFSARLTSVATVLSRRPENSKGIISTAYIKDPTDPTWKDDPGIKA
jgi:hypothetical protein